MASNDTISILFPTGRIVGGDVYQERTEDGEGRPLVVKQGPNIGQPYIEFYVAVAIAKNPGETHFSQTAWGKQMWEAGFAAFPGGQQSPAAQPTFSWKIVDGDSQVPNGKGRRPCDREGYAGHWVLNFTTRFAPKVVNEDGSVTWTEPGRVKPGNFVQVLGTVKGNGATGNQSGIFLSQSIISFQGFHPNGEINYGVDPKSVGFGQGARPAAMTNVPVGGMSPAQAAAVPGAPAVPYTPPAPVATPPGTYHAAGAIPAVPGVPAAPAVPTQPHVGILAPGAVPPPPGVVAAPPVAGPVLKPHVAGTYQDYINAGWTHAQLVQQGMV